MALRWIFFVFGNLLYTRFVVSASWLNFTFVFRVLVFGCVLLRAHKHRKHMFIVRFSFLKAKALQLACELLNATWLRQTINDTRQKRPTTPPWLFCRSHTASDVRSICHRTVSGHSPNEKKEKRTRIQSTQRQSQTTSILWCGMWHGWLCAVHTVCTADAINERKINFSKQLTVKAEQYLYKSRQVRKSWAHCTAWVLANTNVYCVLRSKRVAATLPKINSM